MSEFIKGRVEREKARCAAKVKEMNDKAYHNRYCHVLASMSLPMKPYRQKCEMCDAICSYFCVGCSHYRYVALCNSHDRTNKRNCATAYHVEKGIYVSVPQFRKDHDGSDLIIKDNGNPPKGYKYDEFD